MIGCNLKRVSRSPAATSKTARRPARYSPDEIARLLAVCDRATLPTLPATSAGLWWRAFITVTRTSGLRVSVLLRLDRHCLTRPAVDASPHATEETAALTAPARAALDVLGILDAENLFPWPHTRRQFHAAFRALAKAAGVEDKGLHALRLSHFENGGAL